MALTLLHTLQCTWVSDQALFPLLFHLFLFFSFLKRISDHVIYKNFCKQIEWNVLMFWKDNGLWFILIYSFPFISSLLQLFFFPPLYYFVSFVILYLCIGMSLSEFGFLLTEGDWKDDLHRSLEAPRHWHNVRKYVRWITVKLKKKRSIFLYCVLTIQWSLYKISLLFIDTKASCCSFFRNHL